jgi:hypothetical protein
MEKAEASVPPGRSTSSGDIRFRPDRRARRVGRAERLGDLEEILVPGGRNVGPTMALGLPSRLIIRMVRAARSGCFSARPGAENAVFLCRKRTAMIVRFGRAPAAARRRIASITTENPEPLSTAPVPASNESRWAPRMTVSSGAAVPGIQAATLRI